MSATSFLKSYSSAMVMLAGSALSVASFFSPHESISLKSNQAIFLFEYLHYIAIAAILLLFPRTVLSWIKTTFELLFRLILHTSFAISRLRGSDASIGILTLAFSAFCVGSFVSASSQFAYAIYRDVKYVGLDAVRQHFVARANVQLGQGALVPAIQTYESILQRFPDDDRNYNLELQRDILAERVDASKRFTILSENTAVEGAYASSYFFLESANKLWSNNRQAASTLEEARAEIQENSEILKEVSFLCQSNNFLQVIDLVRNGENLWLNIPSSLADGTSTDVSSLGEELCNSRLNQRVMRESFRLSRS